MSVSVSRKFANCVLRASSESERLLRIARPCRMLFWIKASPFGEASAAVENTERVNASVASTSARLKIRARDERNAQSPSDQENWTVCSKRDVASSWLELW